jgi:hypothetical protein
MLLPHELTEDKCTYLFYHTSVCTSAQAKGYVEGTINKATGIKDSIMGSVMGDKTQEATGNVVPYIHQLIARKEIQVT